MSHKVKPDNEDPHNLKARSNCRHEHSIKETLIWDKTALYNLTLNLSIIQVLWRCVATESYIFQPIYFTKKLIKISQTSINSDSLSLWWKWSPFSRSRGNNSHLYSILRLKIFYLLPTCETDHTFVELSKFLQCCKRVNHDYNKLIQYRS